MMAPPREHDCPLCGHHFSEAGAACGPCPMKKACHAISCPRCGYECYNLSGPMRALRSIACDLKGWLRRSTA